MKRLRLISIVVAVILVGGLAIAIYRDREPRYRGRILTEWIQDGEDAYVRFLSRRKDAHETLETETDWQDASRAVKQMAPDVIPVLSKWVQMKNSPPKRELIDWLNRHPIFHFQIPSAEDSHTTAYFGYMLLGSESKPAWPVLIQWTYSTDPERRFWALICLAASKPDKETLVPVLTRLIHAPDKGLQRAASDVFHVQFPQDAEAAGVYRMFPSLRDEKTFLIYPSHRQGKR